MITEILDSSQKTCHAFFKVSDDAVPLKFCIQMVFHNAYPREVCHTGFIFCASEHNITSLHFAGFAQ